MQSATIAHGVSITGRGLFSGEPCSIKVRPAPRLDDAHELCGLLFESQGRRFRARTALYYEQPNCTVLLAEGAPPVMVTEHLFAALWAAGIDHARIAIEAGLELPNQDGSARPLYDLLAGVGTVELGERPALRLTETIRVEDGESSITIEPSARLSIDYSFSHPELGEQRVVFEDVTRQWALDAILPARTFITQREGELLAAAGLLCNTHSEDALVIRPQEQLDGALEMIPDSPLRFPDEFARHKVLDLLGDLYIVPAEWTGHVTCVRSGHKLNRMLARLLEELVISER